MKKIFLIFKISGLIILFLSLIGFILNYYICDIQPSNMNVVLYLSLLIIVVFNNYQSPSPS